MVEMEIDSSLVKSGAKENEDSSFTCDECQAVFNSKDLFEKHCSTCGENKPRVCLWCHLVFTHEEDVTEHKLTAYQEETETEVKDEGNFDLKQLSGKSEEVKHKNDLDES